MNAGERSWRMSITATVMVLVLAFTVALGALHGVRSDPGPGWGTAQLIETTDLGGAESPHVAVDGSGNAVVVWYQYDQPIYPAWSDIWSNRYVVGSGWGTAELVETDAGGATSNSPIVSVDGSGNAVAVWCQDVEGVPGAHIWSNRYVVGTGWGTTQLVETDNSGSAINPQMSMDSSGNAVAVWMQSRDIYFDIWSNRYVVGTGWGASELIETYDSVSSEDPQVAVGGSGNAVAVWCQRDVSGRYDIWSNRYVVGSGWGTAELIETNDSRNAGVPQVAVDGSGNAIAVWSLSNGPQYDISSNRYVVGSGWGTDELIETEDTWPAYGHQLAVDSSGNAVVMWEQPDNTRFNLWSNRYVVGTGWGVAQLFETNNVGFTGIGIHVLMDGSDNVFLVWSQYDGTHYNMWSNRYVVGTGWGTAELIETNSLGGVSGLDVAVDSSGNVVAVWSHSDGTRDNVWANRYESEEPAIPEFGTVIIPVLSVAAVFSVMRGKRKEICASPWKRP